MKCIEIIFFYFTGWKIFFRFDNNFSWCSVSWAHLIWNIHSLQCWNIESKINISICIKLKAVSGPFPWISMRMKQFGITFVPFRFYPSAAMKNANVGSVGSSEYTENSLCIVSVGAIVLSLHLSLLRLRAANRMGKRHLGLFNSHERL